jgi:protein tyrosine phosphatase
MYACLYSRPEDLRPLATTIPNFWRMVWVNHVDCIIMATDLEEKGKPKCERYFPLEHRKLKYAGITITWISTEQCSGYIKTKYTLHMGGGCR